MKKILLFGGLILLLVELQTHGACLVEKLQQKETCTGAAAGIDNSANQNSYQYRNESNYNQLKKMYQIPTMSVPFNYSNGFPALNQNCMFGACFPDIR